MKTQDYLTLENQVCAPNYKPLPAVIARGQGVWLWDVDDKKYIDMLSAYSALSHGHAHPRLLRVLTEQASRLTVVSRAFYSDRLAPFLAKICQMSGFEMALPMNTGAESVETAIKTARRWGYRVKGIPSNKAEIITMKGNFHGRTTTIISFSSEHEYRDDFGPFTPGFVEVSYGDAAAIEAAITPNTCAVLVEPMQGEAGIVIPPKGWLKAVSEICKKHNVLLICDEVQTGLGRTGKMFAFQHEGIQPDAIILGKALGGGILPVSAFVSRKDILGVFTSGSHGSTFGGNPLASAIGLEALEILEDENLAGRSAELGDYMLKELQKIQSPFIKEVRGSGLWIGVEVDTKQVNARKLCEALLESGVLVKETHHTVIRFAPPLTITKEEIDWAIERIQPIFAQTMQSCAAG